jgi:hypothetical protein
MRRGMQDKAAKRSIGPPGMPRLFAAGIGLGATVASSLILRKLHILRAAEKYDRAQEPGQPGWLLISNRRKTAPVRDPDAETRLLNEPGCASKVTLAGRRALSEGAHARRILRSCKSAYV